jgi:hypothetical protein
LGQQVDHLPANGLILIAKTIRRIEIDQRSRTDDLEMRGIGNRPLQIALSDCFERHNWIQAVDFRLCLGNGLCQPVHGLFGDCGQQRCFRPKMPEWCAG